MSFAASSGSANLAGTIDYGVFLAADFNAAFPGDPQPGAVVYAYQILVDESTVSSDISHLSLAFLTDPLATAFDQILSPDAPYTGFNGIAATSIGSTDPEAADWFFGNFIQPTEYSMILVYSSPYLPTWSGWTVQNGGLQYSSGMLDPLPVPGTMPAPEPGTITLVALAGLFGAPLMVRRIRRRRA